MTTFRRVLTRLFLAFDRVGVPANPLNTDSTRSLVTIVFVWAAVQAAAAAIAARFHLEFGSMTFPMLGDALKFAHTQNLSVIFGAEPPGYALLVAGPIALGIDAFNAGLIITLIFNFVGLVLVFLIARRIFKEGWLVTLCCLAYSLHAMLLGNYLRLWVETVFSVSLLLCYWAVLAFWHDKDKVTWRDAGVLALCFAVPIYLRYIGGIIWVAGPLYLLADGWQDKTRRLKAFAIGVATAALGIPLIVGNFAFSHTLAGQDASIRPAYTFLGALGDFVSKAGAVLLSMRFSILDRSPVFPVVFAGAFVLLVGTMTFLSFKERALRFLVIMLLAYLVGFCVAESTLRLDIISTRFIIPILAPLLIGTVAILRSSSRVTSRFTGGTRHVIMVASSGLLALSCASGMALMAIGVPASASFNYSPLSLRAFSHVIAPGETVLTNRYGRQLTAMRSDIDVRVLPFADSQNGNYAKAYGVRPWTQKELLSEVRTHHVRRIIFFLGRQRTDRYLSSHAYGPAIDSLFSKHDPLVKSKVELADGVMFLLNPTSQLSPSGSS